MMFDCSCNRKMTPTTFLRHAGKGAAEILGVFVSAAESASCRFSAQYITWPWITRGAVFVGCGSTPL